MLDVITIGSATIDAFTIISQKTKEVKLGDKILVEDIDFQIGGGGVNAAVGFSRMGLKTAFLGKLGHDYNAFKILHELKKEKVKVIKTNPSKLKTSFSVVLKSKQEKDRIIFVYKGASDSLDYDEFKKSELNSKWIYMATMLDKSFKTCEQIADYILKNNINLMFNPSSYLAKKGKNKLNKILKATTILVLNKSEAKLLLNTKSNDIKVLLKSLEKLGPELVVITEGPKGVYAYNDGKMGYLPAYNVKVVNTAGAGDAFASGFLSGLLDKNDIAHAMEIGNANATSVVMYHGTRNKLLTQRQANKFIESRKEKVVIKDI